MVERMADVELAGHIGRRNDDAVGLAGVVLRVSTEIAPGDPLAGPAVFNGFRVVRFIELTCGHCCKVLQQDAEKSASGVLTSLRGSTYRSVRLASSLVAALLDSLLEHPEVILALAPYI